MSNTPVLVYVEDNDGDVMLLREAFFEIGREVEILAMHQASDALRYFRIKSTTRAVPPPDGVLLDFRLPDACGGDLLGFLNQDEVLSVVPSFIFVDERRCEQLREELKAHEGQCIAKPSSWDEQIALARWLYHAMRPG